VGIGGMDGRLFVPHEDVLEFVLLVDCVVDVEDRAAGVAKHMVYAFLDQTTHDDVGAIEFHVDSFLDPCRAPSGLSAAWASTGDPRHDPTLGDSRNRFARPHCGTSLYPLARDTRAHGAQRGGNGRPGPRS